MTTCDPSTTISAEDISGLKADITTIDTVVESSELTTTTKNGVVIDTLAGRLLQLGFLPPVVYAAGITFTDQNDLIKTIDRSGIVYAPVPSAIPFTTSGTWVGDDENKFYVVQQEIQYRLDSIAALRAQPAAFTNWVEVQGYYGIGTPGGGPFYWDGASTDADDGGLTILPTGHVGAGRWKRYLARGEVTVLDYGAIADVGVTDSTTFIKNAIASGLTVFIPPVPVGSGAYYQVTDDITVQTGQTVYGTGFYSHIKLTAASTNGQLIGRVGSVGTPAQDITIKGLHLDTSGLTNENGVGFAYGIGTVTTECFFSNIGNKAWTVQIGCTGNLFTDSVIISAQQQVGPVSGAITIEGQTGAVDSSGNIVSNIHIKETGLTAVQLFNTSYNEISNITVDGTVPSRLLYIAGEVGFDCVGNKIDGISSNGTTSRAVELINAARNVMRDVDAPNGDGTMIVFNDNAVGNRVAGGVITTTAAGAVTFSPTTATGNVVDGVGVTSATDAFSVVGVDNEIRSCKIAAGRGINTAGDRTKIVGNTINHSVSQSVNLNADGCTVERNEFGAGGTGGINVVGRDNLIQLNTTANAVPVIGAGDANTVYHNSWDPDVSVKSAAPGAGTWAVGDIVYNSAPAAGGTIGWVCVVAGTPGTWKTFGAIAA